MTEEVMLSGRVPKELKELVDADRRDNQEVLRAALWREFGGERKADIERRIEEKERRVSMIESERNERKRELEREKSELNALKAKLDADEAEQQIELENKMDLLESVPWEPDNPAIQKNADELDMTPQNLIAELEDYYAE